MLIIMYIDYRIEIIINHRECLCVIYRLPQMHRLATTPAPLCYTTCSRGRLFVYLILLYWFLLPPLSGPDTIRNGLRRASIQKSRHRRGARIENK